MRPYLKSIAAGVLAFLGTYDVASLNGQHMTTQAWVAIAKATFLAAATVWGIPNMEAPGVTVPPTSPTPLAATPIPAADPAEPVV